MSPQLSSVLPMQLLPPPFPSLPRLLVSLFILSLPGVSRVMAALYRLRQSALPAGHRPHSRPYSARVHLCHRDVPRGGGGECLWGALLEGEGGGGAGWFFLAQLVDSFICVLVALYGWQR